MFEIFVANLSCFRLAYWTSSSQELIADTPFWAFLFKLFNSILAANIGIFPDVHQQTISIESLAALVKHIAKSAGFNKINTAKSFFIKLSKLMLFLKKSAYLATPKYNILNCMFS